VQFKWSVKVTQYKALSASSKYITKQKKGASALLLHVSYLSYSALRASSSSQGNAALHFQKTSCNSPFSSLQPMTNLLFFPILRCCQSPFNTVVRPVEYPGARMNNVKSFVATGSAVNRCSFFPLVILLQQASLPLFMLLSAGSVLSTGLLTCSIPSVLPTHPAEGLSSN